MMEFRGRKVLLVEDQDMFREAMAFELESLGFSVTTAKEGQEGYECAMAEVFDFILSDVRMPNWDGKRFLQEFRKANAGSPPFAFMTGFTDLPIQEAYDLGADAFLSKPADVERLIATLEVLLQPPEVRWLRATGEEPVVVLKKHLSGWGTADFLDQCAFGRSGLSIAVDTHEIAQARTGDRLGLDLGFAQGPFSKLNGAGILIWKRAMLNGSQTLVGIEFEYLDEPSRNAVLGYIDSVKPTATIPFRKAAQVQ